MMQILRKTATTGAIIAPVAAWLYSLPTGDFFPLAVVGITMFLCAVAGLVVALLIITWFD